MKMASRTLVSALLLAGLVATGLQAQDDLQGYRTAATAQAAQVAAPAAAAPGKVTRAGYLGVSCSADDKGRVVVEDVDAASPAGKAGIQAGDLVRKVEGKSLKDPETLGALVQSLAPGQPLRLQLERAKKKVEVTATLDAVSRPLKFGSERAVIGVTSGDPLDTGGVPIRQVTPGLPAEKAGLKAGDVILKVDGVSLSAAQGLTDTLATRDPGDTVTLTVKRESGETEIKVQLIADPNAANQPSAAPNIWKKDVFRLAVIGIEYPDVKHNEAIKASDWAESLFSEGTYANKNSVTGQPVYGSMNDFYREQSYGKFHVEGKVFDWVTVGKNRGDYNLGSGTGNVGRQLLSDALDKLYEREGATALDEFDGVFFLYAGGRVQTTRGGIYWPHRSNVTYRGKRISYFIVQEGGTRMTDISVFCHEFGHMLGLPDLYARPENPGSEGLGVWCLMSNQTPNGRPQHMSAWCKERLGWIKPVVLDPTVRQKLVLSPIESDPTQCFKVLVRPDASEYLLLENRRKAQFDQSLPAEGLLIWRVVVNRPILEESHGVEGPAGPGVYLSSVPYPSPANNAYTPYTTPSSRSQLGGGLPVHLTNIRKLSDGRVAFQLGYEFH